MPPPFPFVGRGDELARLARLWRQVDDGRRLALVGGEPGAGKSRLVREHALTVAAGGGLVLHGACDPTSGLSYQPLTEALADLVRHAERLSLADLGALGGELTRLFPDLPSRVGGLSAPSVAAPETERHRLHTALVDLLANISASLPVLLVLDDLHWADRSTLLFLRHLLRTRAEARLMVVGAFRDADDEIGEPLADALADLARTPGLLRLRLTGLCPDEIGEFLDGAGGRNGDRDVLVATLRDLTGGNPFLLGELWRHLAETGVLVHTTDGWGLTGPAADIGTPDGVRQVVGQRLARLDPATRALLETAAAAGPETGLGLLRGAVDLDETALLGALEDALRTGLVQQVSGPRPAYRFAHELVRRAVYDRLNPVATARLHLRVARALERLPGDDPRVLADLAAHFTAAAPLGVAAEAAAYSLRAAEAAVHRFAFDQAAALLGHALELGVPEADRGRAQLRRRGRPGRRAVHRPAGAERGERGPGGAARPLRGGAVQAELDAATQEHGLAVTGGTISSTGVGGLTLGGGMGWLTRACGLAVDNLAAAQVVLADGRCVRASADEHPDLLWALTGGGGNFGVVTEFEFRLHPIGPIVHFGLQFWELERAAEGLRAAREVVETLPRDAGGMILAINAPPAPLVPEQHRLRPGVGLALVGLSTPDAHAALMEGARGARPLFEFATAMPSLALQSMLDEGAPPGILAYGKSVYLEELTDEAVDALAALLPAKTSPLSLLPIFPLGGAFADAPDDATAFGGARSLRYAVNMDAVATDPDTLASDRDWVASAWSALRPFAPHEGSYVNFNQEFEPGRVRAAYGTKYARMAGIKAAYDPDNVFHRNPNIRPARHETAA